MLRCISLYRHAVVNTPVARWALIARGTAYSNRFPVPSGGGLPHHCARSATTLDFSRPAQRSLAITACRLAESPSDPSVSKAPTVSFPPRVASIATGWSDPVAGWELHPLKINTFLSRRTQCLSLSLLQQPGRGIEATLPGQTAPTTYSYDENGNELSDTDRLDDEGGDDLGQSHTNVEAHEPSVATQGLGTVELPRRPPDHLVR